MANAVAESDIDLWSDENLSNPYPTYATLRDQAAVVRLTQSDVWCLTRYDVIKEALNDWETYSSVKAIGFNDGVDVGWIVKDVAVNSISFSARSSASAGSARRCHAIASSPRVAPRHER